MKKTALATLGLLFVLACSASTELTRGVAKSLLSTHTTLTSHKNAVNWVDGGYQEYVAQGGPNNPAFAKVVLSANDREVTLNVDVTRAVDEITGISDPPIGQGMKEVQFRWSNRGIPDVMKALLCLGGTGRALFRRYDDGWRVDEIASFDENRALPVLTAAQKAQIEQFKTAERERQQKERQAYEDLLARSKTPTKELARGQFQGRRGDYGEFGFAAGESHPNRCQHHARIRETTSF